MNASNQFNFSEQPAWPLPVRLSIARRHHRGTEDTEAAQRGGEIRERANVERRVVMSDTVGPILLVEDRLTDLDLTKRAFERRHLLNPIQVARDGEEALAYIERWEKGEEPPVFILLDLGLPKISGLEVLRQLRSHPKSAAIPVVVLTTSAEDRDIQEAYKLGCNSYIVKPVEFDKFLEVASQVEVYWCLLNQTPRL
jgi:CheY-like chemotaxis protein